MGFAIKWDDTTHYFRIGLRLNLGSDDIVIQDDEGAGIATTSLYDLDANLNASQYKTGEHRFRLMIVFAGAVWLIYTLAIDNTMLVTNKPQPSSFPAVTYDNKGFIIDVNSVVKFDDLVIRTINNQQLAKTYSATPNRLIYTLTLTGTPYKSANKKDFLKHILSNYSPFAVDITVACG